MPSSSSFFCRLASLKRAGGLVKCWLGAMSIGASSWSASTRGRITSSLLGMPMIFKKPSKTKILPVARNSASTLAGSMVMAVLSHWASTIWQLTKRRQIRSYRRYCSSLSLLCRSCGVSVTSVGRMASWASCASLLDVL